MNKLQEILDEFQSLYGWRIQDDLQDEVREYLCEGIAEYARSVAPKEKNEFCKGCSRPKHERAMMLECINQDLQSLNK